MFVNDISNGLELYGSNECWRCDGTGEIEVQALGSPVCTEICDICNGSGKITEKSESSDYTRNKSETVICECGFRLSEDDEYQECPLCK
jgi:DnaJ-class molecular chaperone